MVHLGKSIGEPWLWVHAESLSTRHSGCLVPSDIDPVHQYMEQISLYLYNFKALQLEKIEIPSTWFHPSVFNWIPLLERFLVNPPDIPCRAHPPVSTRTKLTHPY